MDEDVRQALRVARQAAGFSIAQLARLVRFSESHLRSVENGNRKITDDLVGAYDEVLGMGGILVDLYATSQDDDLRKANDPKPARHCHRYRNVGATAYY